MSESNAFVIAVRNLSALVVMIGTALILSSLSQHILAACLSSSLRIPESVINCLSGVVANILCLNESLVQDKQLGNDRMQLTPEETTGDQSDTSRERTIRENQWRMIFVLIDRLFFTIYSIIFVTKKI